MAKKVISFSDILKRQTCLNSSSESIDSKLRLNQLDTKLESWDGKEITPSISSSMYSFLNSLKTISNASSYYEGALSLINRFTEINESTQNKLTNTFVKEILPYMRDPLYAAEAVNRYEGITDDNKEKIIEAANSYVVADRVINNYKALNKRFKINENHIVDPNRFAESICEKVDTYDIESYQKMNICIEETMYILNKNKVPYVESKVIDTIGRYFMLIESFISDEDIKGYRKVLEENNFISENDICKYITQDSIDYEYSKIESYISEFLSYREKSFEKLSDIVAKICSTCDVEDLCYNFSNVVTLIWDFYKYDSVDISDVELNELIKIITDCLTARQFESSDYGAIIGSIEKGKESIIVAYNTRLDYREKVFDFKDKLKVLQNNLDTVKNSSYSKSNLNIIEQMYSESSEDMILFNEFKLFKHHNLLNATWNFSKWLKIKNKNMNDKLKKKGKSIIKKVKDILFPENADIYSTFNECDRFDACVCQYEYVDEQDLGIINDYFDTLCREYNQILAIEGKNDIKAFYIVNPYVVEVHLGCTKKVQLTEEEHNLALSTWSEAEDIYLEIFCKHEMIYSVLEDITLDNIFNLVENKQYTSAEFEIVKEALSMLGIEKPTMTTLAESVNMPVEETWKPEEGYDMISVAEAYQILQAVAEKAKPIDIDKIKDPDIDSEVVKDGKKVNPFKGINLNSLKLYLYGLKKKASNASQKEKEISRNVDNSFRRLIKSMKNSLISDRREAIIKGSVIPSFSRCIKIAVALAGLGLIFHNPAVPVIAAIGGFAMSKQLTKKERILLLDEIDTELEVLDKEIANAESKNQMKKYRALLKYKKDLQRQYQRIRYNVRIGKDLLPNSATGVRDSE
jgi:hypothetical protein